jgi:hypothetical protein
MKTIEEKERGEKTEQFKRGKSRTIVEKLEMEREREREEEKRDKSEKEKRQGKCGQMKEKSKL